MPPVSTSLASEMPNRGCPPKEGIHQTRGSAWWHACHQVVPTREWTPASQRPNVQKYEIRETRRSGKKGKEGGNHWRGGSTVGGERQGEERGAESQQRAQSSERKQEQTHHDPSPLQGAFCHHFAWQQLDLYLRDSGEICARPHARASQAWAPHKSATTEYFP